MCTNTPGSYECVCLDQNSNCPMWEAWGECEKNPDWMLVNCKNSCKVCENRAACVNTNKDCEYWQKEGQCNKDPTWMAKYCARSCNKC